MKTKLPGLHFAVFFIFSALFAAAEEYQVRIDPEPIFVQFGVKEEPLTPDDLVLLSLAVSGTEENRLQPVRAQVHELLGAAEEVLSDIENPYTLGEGLLNFLHRELFSRYDENQSGIDQLLEDGRYNCVSSSIIYLIFARFLGLEVTGVATADHTFCMVAAVSGGIDVETTTIYGFDPGTKKEFTSAFGETGFSYVPPGNYRSRWTVSDRKLISYVLQNRISLLERKKRYGRAVELAVDRYHLVRDDETWSDMIKEFVNFAALLNERADYDGGLSFLESVEKRYGPSPEFREVRGVLVNNKVIYLMGRGDYKGADRFLDTEMSGEKIDREVGRKLQTMIVEKEIVTIITTTSFEAALLKVEQFWNAGKIAQDQYADYIVYLYGKKSERLAEGREWLKAIETIDAGLAKIGTDSRFLQAKQAFRHNFAAEKHNEFAGLINRGLREEAIQVLEEALELMPDSELLQKDYNQLMGGGSH
jgi:tetratricopeptide (TPR) repeat protein